MDPLCATTPLLRVDPLCAMTPRLGSVSPVSPVYPGVSVTPRIRTPVTPQADPSLVAAQNSAHVRVPSISQIRVIAPSSVSDGMDPLSGKLAPDSPVFLAAEGGPGPSPILGLLSPSFEGPLNDKQFSQEQVTENNSPIRQKLHLLTQESIRMSDDLQQARAEMAKLMEENQALREEKVSGQALEVLLRSENDRVWTQLRENRQKIGDIQHDLHDMKNQTCALPLRNASNQSEAPQERREDLSTTTKSSTGIRETIEVLRTLAQAAGNGRSGCENLNALGAHLEELKVQMARITPKKELPQGSPHAATQAGENYLGPSCRPTSNSENEPSLKTPILSNTSSQMTAPARDLSSAAVAKAA